MKTRVDVPSLVALLCVPSLLLAQAPSLSTPAVEARIDALLKRMTLEEKVGQVNQISPGIAFGPQGQRLDAEAQVAAGRVGSMLNLQDGKQADAFQKIAMEQSRLHIPLIFGLDVIHGYRTTFPIPLGLASTWDPKLIEQTCRVAAQEASAQGVRWTFSPMVDIARDARWGRIAESAGEDPYLGAVLAKAYVRGYQGERLDEPTSILACVKHFVGYGAAEGGRDYNSTEISERLLRQVYFPPFQAAIQEGTASLMASFNALNGVPVTSNAFILDQILRREWGFQGLLVSDYDAVAETIPHGIANDGATAARKAFLAGLDVDMGGGVFLSELATLVRSGAVPQTRLDEAVRRLLRLKFALGLFEHPYTGGAPADTPLSPKALELARRAAEESFVLLRNEAIDGTPLLPLKARVGKKIALIGPHAEDAVEMLGSWSVRGRAADVTTLRAALAQRMAQEQMTLLCAKGTDYFGTDESGFAQALSAAREADVVVMTLGETAEHTGEGTSRAHLDLPGNQEKLLEAVAATGKPIVLLLFTGRPLTITWASQHVPAILEAWAPGNQAGPALVRTLFGDVNPCGRLTVSFPRAVGQEPLYYNALSTGRPVHTDTDLTRPPRGYEASRWTSRYIAEFNAPLYPFGHGLSYTTFQFSPVKVSAQSLSATAVNEKGAQLTASAEVTNTGTRAGTTVVQLYLRLQGTSVARPVRELKGFQRLELAPGQTGHVTFQIGREALAFWNLDMKELAEPATLTLWIGPDSASGSPAEVRLTD